MRNIVRGIIRRHNLFLPSYWTKPTPHVIEIYPSVYGGGGGVADDGVDFVVEGNGIGCLVILAIVEGYVGGGRGFVVSIEGEGWRDGETVEEDGFGKARVKERAVVRARRVGVVSCILDLWMLVLN